MKSNISISRLSILLVLFLSLTSCGDFLDLKPLNGVVVENYWQKESKVEAVVNSCYIAMQGSGFTQRLIAWGEMRGDNVTETSTLQRNTDLYGFYTNNITTSSTMTDWTAFYNVINLCNTVLYYAPEAQKRDNNFTTDALMAYEAEACAIRALCYFYLIRTYEKVPLNLEATIGDDKSFEMAASSEADVIAQIKDDLNFAEEHIWSRNYFDNEASRKGRLNKQSVMAILADVDLWNGDYQECANLCQTIIDEKQQEYQQLQQSGNGGSLRLYNGYPLIDNAENTHAAYQAVFVSGDSFESIFEMYYSNDNNIANAGLTSYYGNLTNQGSGMLNAASYLTQSNGPFTNNHDSRLYENTGYVSTNATATSYYIQKYRMTYGTGTTGDRLVTKYPNWIFYRLTNIMLMRAEALAYLGGEANNHEAFLLVEAVNDRACSGQSTLTEDDGDIKTMILEERQRELMFEGKRWYDLVRMVRHSDNPTNAMSVLRNTYLLRKYEHDGRDAVTRLASVHNLYLPFNKSEVAVNPLLEADQNEAYK